MRQEQMPQFKKAHPNMNSRDCMKEIGKLWRSKDAARGEKSGSESRGAGMSKSTESRGSFTSASSEHSSD